MTTFSHTTDGRPTTPDTTTIRATIRTALLAAAIGLTVALAMTTLGLSYWLALIAGLAIPVIAAWWILCGQLEAHEPELDAMLTERRNTLRTTARAARGQHAYTGKTVKLDEVER